MLLPHQMIAEGEREEDGRPNKASGGKTVPRNEIAPRNLRHKVSRYAGGFS
jgi:hypothetical protein